MTAGNQTNWRGTIEERFWRKVKKEKDDECWEWIGGKNSSKYGILLLTNKRTSILAHRFSYELHKGKIPKGKGYHGMCVCHSCDNPSCVNPNHLWLGTNIENMRDKETKGRGRGFCHQDHHGENHPQVKLTWKIVEEIREMHKNGFLQKEIAKKFNISNSGISKIISNKRWIIN
jgi:predicted XRE-type DNA-binding protein